MAKKTILHIVDLSMTGGKQEGALSVILSQPFKNRYEQSVFNTEKRSIKDRYRKKLLDDGIQIYEANTFVRSENKLVRKFIFFYTLVKVKPEIIVLWSVLPSFMYYLIKRVLNIKTVFWDRGVSSSRNPTKLITFSLNKCDLILCNSVSTKILLSKKWLVHKAEVCHNAIRNDVIPELNPVKQLANDSIKLGFAGRLIPLKGVGLAIESVRILKDRSIHVNLFIAGEKNEEYDFLKNLSKKYDVEDQIHFLGNLSNMKDFYQMIDIFICPSLREPFGLVSVEAASNGCPVIISKIDGLAETVEDKVTGIAITPRMPLNEYVKYVSSQDGIPEYVYFPDKQDMDRTKAVYPEEIADSVEQLILTDNLFKRYSEASYNMSIKKFSMEKHIDCAMKKFDKLN